jgi:hypothetical protein
MLWPESDRMGFLMDAVTQKKIEIQLQLLLVIIKIAIFDLLMDDFARISHVYSKQSSLILTSFSYRLKTFKAPASRML